MKIKSWDGNNINDTTNYEAFETPSFYGLPTVGANLGGRGKIWPVFGGLERGSGRSLYFDVYIRGGSSAELCEWFDYEDETAKKLLVTDADGSSNPRYVMAVCTGLREMEDSGGLGYSVSIVIDGDIRWRENTATTDTWSITASGQTKALTNNGDDKAYPILSIKPTSAKSSSWAYKIWIPIRWNIDTAYNSYPIDITDNSFDTASLTTAKMQADGDDLRVWVDGIEVDRWLDDMDTATTSVWCNIDFAAKQEATLGTAIASSGAITTIVASTDISGFPNSGIVIIDSEAFTYTSKSNGGKTFYGVTRAMRGTSMAAHTTTDTIWWVQHDIYILYGNSAASAPDVDDDYQPIFTLASSSNTSWDYDNFGEDDGLRTGAWWKWYGEGVFYTANRNTDADPWSEMGIDVQYDTPSAYGGWRMYNPCGITNANFQNGEKYASVATNFFGRIRSSVNGSSWPYEYTIPDPSADATWESWSDNEALNTGSKYVSMFFAVESSASSGYALLEVSDVTLTIDSSNTPTITLGSEQSNYSLDCTITNNTTEESIHVTFTMAVDDTIEINTDVKTVIWDADNSSQFQALDILGDPRLAWLALDPGSNTIQFDDTGTNAVTFDFEWDERHYD